VHFRPHFLAAIEFLPPEIANGYVTAGELLLDVALLRSLNDYVDDAMSHQAMYVGRPGDAVDLARAAQISARQAGIGTLESECHIVEAHGHAGRDDASACATALIAAEGAFERGDEAPPAWLQYFDEAYLAAKIAHCFRDLGDHKRTSHYAEQSLNMSDGYLRGRAFNLCVLASAHTHEDPDEAVRLGNEAIDIVEQLSSRRSHSYLRDLRSRLHPHAHRDAVAQFRERVRRVSQRA